MKPIVYKDELWYMKEPQKKLLESLNYEMIMKLEPYSVVIYDRDGNELEETKIPPYDVIGGGYGSRFKGRNGEDIYFDSLANLEISLSDNLKIISNYTSYNSSQNLIIKSSDPTNDKNYNEIIFITNIAETNGCRNIEVHVKKYDDCKLVQNLSLKMEQYQDSTDYWEDIDNGIIQIPIDPQQYMLIILSTIHKGDFYYPNDIEKALNIALPALEVSVDDFKYENERLLAKKIEVLLTNQKKIEDEKQKFIDSVQDKINEFDDKCRAIDDRVAELMRKRDDEKRQHR